MESGAINELEEQLREGSGPALLFSHHPLGSPDLTGNIWFEHRPHLALLDKRETVQRVIAESGRVMAAVNGHCHWNQLHHQLGVPYLTLQSLTENVAGPDQEAVPAAAWAVLEIFADQIVVQVAGAEPLVHHLAVRAGHG